uniref:Mitochondrial glutathione transporter SLC25A39 n=2 Tax=Canis lupus familiaris TaxID=9615 RepID=A0A8I3NQG0_CANLF
MPDQDPGAISPLQQTVASGTGAVVTSLFMTPLDVVKVRLQSQRPLTASEPMPPSRLWSLPYAKSPSSPIHREVPPILQWCSGTPVLVSKWCPLCHLVSGPYPLHGHHGRFCEDREARGTRTLWSGLPATLVMTVPATDDQPRTFLCGRALTSDLYAPMVAAALARSLYWFNYELVKSWLSGLRPKGKRPDIRGHELCGWRHLRDGGDHPDSTLRRGEDSMPGRAGGGGGCERLSPKDHQGRPFLCHHDQHV